MFLLLLILTLLIPASAIAQTWPVIFWQGNDSMFVNNPCGSVHTQHFKPITNSSEQPIQIEIAITADTSLFEITLADEKVLPSVWTRTLAPGDTIRGLIKMTARGDERSTATLVLKVAGFADSASASYTIISIPPSFKEWPSVFAFDPTPVGKQDTLPIEIEATHTNYPSYFKLISTHPAFKVLEDSVLVIFPTTYRFNVVFSPTSDGPVNSELLLRGDCFEGAINVTGTGLSASVQQAEQFSQFWRHDRAKRSLMLNTSLQHSLRVRLIDAVGRTSLETVLATGQREVSLAGLTSGWYVIVTEVRDRVLTQKLLLN